MAPDARLPNNQKKADLLRYRVAGLVQREAEGGKRVLVMATLPVRRVLTGETDCRVPVSVPWCGADLSHFGRHLGVDGWRDHDTVIVLGREQLPPLAAERVARAIWADAPGITLDLPGEYGREQRRHDIRAGTSPAVTVQAHPDPRVQAVVELRRENAIGQAVDRLRLVHRDPAHPARVIVLTNLPVPGLVVDRLNHLENVLAGGTVMERALARMPGGVLPLSPDWLAVHLPDLVPSRRTAARLVTDLRVPTGNRDTYCRLALFRAAGQRCPSKALVRPDVAAPRAELERLLGAKLVEFRMVGGEAEPAPAAIPRPVTASPAPLPDMAAGLLAGFRRHQPPVAAVRAA